VIDSSDPPLNLNTNISNNNNSNNITNTNANTNINNNNINSGNNDNTQQQASTTSAPSTNKVDSKKEKEEKKESVEPCQKKEEDKKQEVQNNTSSTNTNTNNHVPNTQNNTRANNNATNNNDFNNLFGNIMNQLMTPENMNSIVGAVDNMLNNPQESNNSQGGGFNFGNLLGNLMNSINIEEGNNVQQNNQPSAQQTQQKKEETKKESSNTPMNTTNISNSSSIFEKLAKSEQLRKETKISDDKIIGEAMSPNIEFAPLSDQIVSNLTVQDMFDMYNLNFGGLCRMRKEIQSKYFADKSKSDDVVKNVVELLCERIILIENQIDKILPGKEFILEDFFNIELKKVLLMFIDDKEVNLKDDEWEQKFRKLVIDMFKKLIDELKNLYETREDGAKTFVEFNITGIIENFIGNKYLTAVQNYDDNVMNNFVENLFNIIKNEEIKNKCDDKKEEKENKEKKEEENTKSDNNEEKPTLLSIDEIFKIATKDKERLDKEEKGNNGDKKEEKKYSDFYYMTSLFKN
jgi:hypothetical protein